MADIKITTPEDMKGDLSSLPYTLRWFEEELSKKEKGMESYCVGIFEECPPAICKAVEEAYTKAGWKKVECERDGPMTYLSLSIK